MFGELVFFSFVTITRSADPDGYDKFKRTRLATVHCKHEECAEKIVQFRENNPHIRARDIHAEFVYRETMG